MVDKDEGTGDMEVGFVGIRDDGGLGGKEYLDGKRKIGGIEDDFEK